MTGYRTRLALLAAGFAASAQAGDLQHVKGGDVHCVGHRAHLLDYDILGEPNDGSSLAKVSNAQITVRPTPSRDDECVPAVKQGLLGTITNGSKQYCYGANAAPSCDAAQAVLPIEEYLECESCWLGAKADLFYSLNYSGVDVHSVEVGLQDMHLKGEVEVHATPQVSGEPVATGSMTLRDGHSVAVFDKIVGCPVCVRVKVSVAVPTALNYSLTLSGGLDATVGAAVDADLGDHYIRWDHENGFQNISTAPSLKWTPFLSKASAKAEADLSLSLQSSVQVDVDQVIWYHMNMAAPMPFKVTLTGEVGDPKAELCASGTVGLDMAHEADLHVTLFGETKDIKHWGPHDLFHKTKALQKCVDVPTDRESMLVV